MVDHHLLGYVLLVHLNLSNTQLWRWNVIWRELTLSLVGLHADHLLWHSLLFDHCAAIPS